MKRTLLAVCSALLLSATLFAEGKMTSGARLGTWTMDAQAAFALAKEQGKPLFLNFTGSDWCGWCKLMEGKVFSTEAWQVYAKENLVLVWVDFPRDRSLVPEEIVPQNKALSEKYAIRGFPTYIILSPEGEQIGQLGASQDATPESFIKQLGDILALQNIESLLSAEDLATYQAAKAELETLEAEMEAWQQEVEAQFNAKMAVISAANKKVEDLKAKALENR